MISYRLASDSVHVQPSSPPALPGGPGADTGGRGRGARSETCGCCLIPDTVFRDFGWAGPMEGVFWMASNESLQHRLQTLNKSHSSTPHCSRLSFFLAGSAPHHTPLRWGAVGMNWVEGRVRSLHWLWWKHIIFHTLQETTRTLPRPLLGSGPPRWGPWSSSFQSCLASPPGLMVIVLQRGCQSHQSVSKQHRWDNYGEEVLEMINQCLETNMPSRKHQYVCTATTGCK